MKPMPPSVWPAFIRKPNAALHKMLQRIQNDLFDLGADLATPETEEKPDYEPLRIVEAQVERIEADIDYA